MEILHDPVHGAAVAPAVLPGSCEGGPPPDPLGLLFFRSVLGRLLILFPALPSGGRLLGGRPGSGGIGIDEGQGIFQGLRRIPWDGGCLLGLLLLHRFPFLMGVQIAAQADDPGMIADRTR